MTQTPPYQVTDPATGEVAGTFPFATDAEVAEALAAASGAFAAWGARPVAERAAVVQRIAGLFTERAVALAALITKEMGKRPAQAVGEAQFCTDIFNYYADNGPGLIADKPLPGHDTARRVPARRPGTRRDAVELPVLPGRGQSSDFAWERAARCAAHYRQCCAVSQSPLSADDSFPCSLAVSAGCCRARRGRGENSAWIRWRLCPSRCDRRETGQGGGSASPVELPGPGCWAGRGATQSESSSCAPALDDCRIFAC